MGLKIFSSEGSFRDREDAGKLLAEELRDPPVYNPLVLGVPRGGVVVAYEVAKQLGAELDVVIARKIGAPWNPELALGAVMEGGTTYINPDVISLNGASEKYINEEKARQQKILLDRAAQYRQVREFVPRKGRNVIVVDDGVATGSTMIATLHGLGIEKSASLMCVLPVGPLDTLEALEKIADEVVCLLAPDFFQAVGQFYYNFSQVSDDEVLNCLRQSVKN